MVLKNTNGQLIIKDNELTFINNSNNSFTLTGENDFILLLNDKIIYSKDGVKEIINDKKEKITFKYSFDDFYVLVNYLNEDNKMCARLRDKKTNKLVSITGKNANKNHLLMFLSQVKIQNNIVPTIYDKDGSDSVIVTGIIDSQNENEIVVNIDILGGGYLVE